MSPRSSRGGHVDLHGVARGERLPAAGRRRLERHLRRRGVGRGRQQVRQRAVEQLLARGRADLLEAEPERHGVRGREGGAARLGLRRGDVELDALLAQRLLDGEAGPVAQPRRRLRARRRGAGGVLVGVVPGGGVERERRHRRRTGRPRSPSSPPRRARGCRSPSTRTGCCPSWPAPRRRGSSARCRWRCRGSAGTRSRAGRRRPRCHRGRRSRTPCPAPTGTDPSR